MLITQMKDAEVIKSLIRGKAFVINCHGCKEVHFPVSEAEALQKALAEAGLLTGSITTDYISLTESAGASTI